MTSEALRIEQQYPAGHRNRHIPHLCTECGRPLPSYGICDHCAGRAADIPERRVERFPDAATRLERMERAAARS